MIIVIERERERERKREKEEREKGERMSGEGDLLVPSMPDTPLDHTPLGQ